MVNTKLTIIVETLRLRDEWKRKVDLDCSVNGAQGRDRTTDTVIFSHVLYQLSYLGPKIWGCARAIGRSERLP